MDKFKPCRGITPRSWLDKNESSVEEQKDDPGLPARLGETQRRSRTNQIISCPLTGMTIDGQKMDENSLDPEQTATLDSGLTMETDHTIDDDNGQPVRPKRTRKPPSHLRHFIVDRVQQTGLVSEAGSSTSDQTLPVSERLLKAGQTDVLLNPWEAHAVWFRDADQAFNPLPASHFWQ